MEVKTEIQNRGTWQRFRFPSVDPKSVDEETHREADKYATVTISGETLFDWDVRDAFLRGAIFQRTRERSEEKNGEA